MVPTLLWKAQPGTHWQWGEVCIHKTWQTSNIWFQLRKWIIKLHLIIKRYNRHIYWTLSIQRQINPVRDKHYFPIFTLGKKWAQRASVICPKSQSGGSHDSHQSNLVLQSVHLHFHICFFLFEINLLNNTFNLNNFQ